MSDNDLLICPGCSCHVRLGTTECPFCDTSMVPPTRRKRGPLTTLAFSAGVSVAALSLQACYGPPRRGEMGPERTKPAKTKTEKTEKTELKTKTDGVDKTKTEAVEKTKTG